MKLNQMISKHIFFKFYIETKGNMIKINIRTFNNIHNVNKNVFSLKWLLKVCWV